MKKSKMRIYEIAIEYSKGEDGFHIVDRFRISCNTFKEALQKGERRIRSMGDVVIASIEIIADTHL